MEINGEEEWEVEEVSDAKIKYRRLQYLIKWTGCDIPDWRNAKDVNRLQAINIFQRRHPCKPGPLTRPRGRRTRLIEVSTDFDTEEGDTVTGHRRVRRQKRVEGGRKWWEQRETDGS